MEKRIFLSSPTMHDEEMNFIQEAFDRNWVAPLGFNCDGFESEMVEYLGHNNEDYYAVALASGTAALFEDLFDILHSSLLQITFCIFRNQKAICFVLQC